MTESTTVGIVGAGATGGYLAARLTMAGVPVSLVVRGESLERIRADGIEIVSPDGERSIARPHRVVAAHQIDQPADIVLFCVKSYDTEGATALVGPLLGTDGHIVCLQNGVKNEQVLAAAFGGSRVLSGVLYIGSERVSPGVIACSSPPRIIVGPYDGVDDRASSAVQELFAKAEIDCEVRLDVLAAKWQKFLFNCGLNPLTAITGQRMGQLLAEEASADVFHTLVDEALAVGKAAGAPLTDDARDAVTATAHRMDISSSMAEDLEAGRAIELDAFTGYVISLGRQHEVATPATRVVHGILTALDAGRRAPADG